MSNAAIVTPVEDADKRPTYHLSRSSHTCKIQPLIEGSDPVYGGNFKKLRHQAQFYEVQVDFVSETPIMKKQRGSQQPKAMLEVADQSVVFTIFDTKYYAEVLQIVAQELVKLCGDSVRYLRMVATLRIMNLVDTTPASA